MPAVRVDILCECEGCHKRFGVEIDDIAEPLKGGRYDNFEDMVRWYIRGGNAPYYTWGVRGQRTIDRFPLSRQPIIEAGLMLCDECGRKCDDFPVEPEDRALTRAEVNKVLGLPTETT